MNAIKTIFSAAALAIGGTFLTAGSVGLITDGFDTSDEIGGIDATPLGVAATAGGAVLFGLGIYGITGRDKKKATTPKGLKL